MEKTKTKKSLVLSLFSMLLCCAMLIGTTFAWFTDSVTSGVNKITAGNLDVELEYSKDMENWEPVQNSETIFDKDALWEPGRTEVIYLRIANEGTLAMKYQLAITVAREVSGTNVNGETFKLSDYIKFGQVEDVTAVYTDRADAVAAVDAQAGIISNGYTAAGTMDKDAQTKTVALVVYMPESVGNEANYRAGSKVPSINLGINLVATQNTVENDSYGNDYDNGVILANSSQELATAAAEAVKGQTVMLNAGSYAFPATIGEGVKIAGTASGATLKVDENDITSSGVTIEDVDISVSYAVKSFEIKGNDITLSNVNIEGGSPSTYGASADIYSSKATIKNTTTNGAFRGLQCWNVGDTLLIENSTLGAKCYTMNVDAGTGKIIAKNSTFKGWTSYASTIESATFTDCTFVKNDYPGSYGYNCVAAYTDTTFTNCTFGEGFAPYAQINGLNWTFDNCTMNGVDVTADNFKTLFPEDAAVWTGCTCMVNGVTVTA